MSFIWRLCVLYWSLYLEVMCPLFRGYFYCVLYLKVMIHDYHTVEPPNNGHIGTSHYREVSTLRRQQGSLYLGHQSLSIIQRLFLLCLLSEGPIIDVGTSHFCPLYSTLRRLKLYQVYIQGSLYNYTWDTNQSMCPVVLPEF